MKVDIAKLKYRCEQDEESLFCELLDQGGEVYDVDNQRYLGFKNNGAKVLAVAHCDYVDVPYRFGMDKARTRVYTPRLDDRLGVYTILDLLPQLGISVDILLTTDEEIGRSTASEFTRCFPNTAYSWVVEFDRRGENVVTYDLDSPEWLTALRGVGYSINQGSFSDISYLGLDCCMVNVGVGYHHEHSRDCYVELAEYKRQIARFQRFYSKFHDKEFLQDSTPTIESGTPWWKDKPVNNWGSKRTISSDTCRICDDWLLASEWDYCAACLAAGHSKGV